MHTCMCVRATTCMWRSEDNLGCQILPSILIEAEPLVHCCICQASWPASFWELSISHPTTGIPGLEAQTTAFSVTRVLRIQTQGLPFVQQVLYPLCHLPCPKSTHLGVIWALSLINNIIQKKIRNSVGHRVFLYKATLIPTSLGAGGLNEYLAQATPKHVLNRRLQQ